MKSDHAYLIDFMATVFLRKMSTSTLGGAEVTYLEVPLDVHQQRDVANTSHDKTEEGDGKDGDSESGRHSEGGGDIVAVEVLANVVPRPVVLFGEVERVKGQRVNGLARAISKEKPLPA